MRLLILLLVISGITQPVFSSPLDDLIQCEAGLEALAGSDEFGKILERFDMHPRNGAAQPRESLLAVQSRILFDRLETPPENELLILLLASNVLAEVGDKEKLGEGDRERVLSRLAKVLELQGKFKLVGFEAPVFGPGYFGKRLLAVIPNENEGPLDLELFSGVLGGTYKDRSLGEAQQSELEVEHRRSYRGLAIKGLLGAAGVGIGFYLLSLADTSMPTYASEIDMCFFGCFDAFGTLGRLALFPLGALVAAGSVYKAWIKGIPRAWALPSSSFENSLGGASVLLVESNQLGSQLGQTLAKLGYSQSDFWRAQEIERRRSIREDD